MNPAKKLLIGPVLVLVDTHDLPSGEDKNERKKTEPSHGLVWFRGCAVGCTSPGEEVYNSPLVFHPKAFLSDAFGLVVGLCCWLDQP